MNPEEIPDIPRQGVIGVREIAVEYGRAAGRQLCFFLLIKDFSAAASGVKTEIAVEMASSDHAVRGGGVITAHALNIEI